MLNLVKSNQVSIVFLGSESMTVFSIAGLWRLLNVIDNMNRPKLDSNWKSESTVLKVFREF